MKIRVTAVLLLLIISIPMLSKVTLWVYFFSNRPKIAQTLCINKDIPESCCKGKCYLGSQLKKIDDNQREENKSIPSVKKIKEIPFEVNEKPTIHPTVKNLFKIKFPELAFQPLNSTIISVFHPPEA